MSTRSYINIELPDGQMLGIYCHWDGYLEGVGQTLVDFWGDRTKAEELFKHGDVSSLGDTIDDCEFYSRDRGEEINPARIITEEQMRDSWAEYFYLYRLDDNWYVKTAYNDIEKDWILLEAALDNPDLIEDELEVEDEDLEEVK